MNEVYGLTLKTRVENTGVLITDCGIRSDGIETATTDTTVVYETIN